VLGLLFVLGGDGLPCRTDLLALGGLLGRLHRLLTGGGIRSQRGPQFRQFLLDPGQGGLRPRHFTGLGHQQRKPRGTRTGKLGPVLGPSQGLRRTGEPLMLSAQGVQFLLCRSPSRAPAA
jgi:hypothetical protein